MGCSLSQPEIHDPRDLDNPADVPCSACGVYNYVEPKRRQVECFKCKATVSRFDRRAEGLVNEYLENRIVEQGLEAMRRSGV